MSYDFSEETLDKIFFVLPLRINANQLGSDLERRDADYKGRLTSPRFGIYTIGSFYLYNYNRSTREAPYDTPGWNGCQKNIFRAQLVQHKKKRVWSAS